MDQLRGDGVREALARRVFAIRDARDGLRVVDREANPALQIVDVSRHVLGVRAEDRLYAPGVQLQTGVVAPNEVCALNVIPHQVSAGLDAGRGSAGADDGRGVRGTGAGVERVDQRHDAVEAVRVGAGAVPKLRADGDAAGDEHALRFVKLRVTDGLLQTGFGFGIDDGFVHLQLAIEEKTFGELLAVARLHGVAAVVGFAESDGGERARRGLVNEAGDRAAGEHLQLGGEGRGFFEQTNRRIGAGAFRDVEKGDECVGHKLFGGVFPGREGAGAAFEFGDGHAGRRGRNGGDDDRGDALAGGDFGSPDAGLRGDLRGGVREPGVRGDEFGPGGSEFRVSRYEVSGKGADGLLGCAQVGRKLDGSGFDEGGVFAGGRQCSLGGREFCFEASDFFIRFADVEKLECHSTSERESTRAERIADRK